ncbi:heat-inducible transcription repressor HrcA [Thalassoporum mexicanum PCC 7367]|uniref:heat-inducible transcriptional repressor HrcA n=1 Tax=Thalassoporum mexicanum TaxID=3457544 RepID=UPI00029FCA89|nr:heat-inducible transcriptional repressor HrcA [Pseudanabaena sp. PCC 7367]AFY68723.1 heat-inducible transcription repressor HrcA [Pseudanabaena sp. PCC 7367]
MKAKLNNREQKVLWATINHYIATAEPVGSKVLVNEYDFKISPATIRNVMGALDRSGFLYQPHTSAGRVPSNSGYRIYVDELISPNSLQAETASRILLQRTELIGRQSLEIMLHNLTQILATLTGCIALITAPSGRMARIKHIQLVPVDDRKVMAIAISDSYDTVSVLMDLPPELSSKTLESELQTISNFINSQIQDQNLAEFDYLLPWQELDRQFLQYTDFIEESLKQLTSVCQTPAMGQLFISGIREILQQPEFNELSQLQSVIEILEGERDRLFPLISQQSQPSLANAVSVKIGTEIDLEAIQNCALIYCDYKYANTAVGSVGVLGPTRMNYENAIASVEATASHLAEAIKLVS